MEPNEGISLSLPRQDGKPRGDDAMTTNSKEMNQGMEVNKIESELVMKPQEESQTVCAICLEFMGMCNA